MMINGDAPGVKVIKKPLRKLIFGNFHPYL